MMNWDYKEFLPLDPELQVQIDTGSIQCAAILEAISGRGFPYHVFRIRVEKNIYTEITGETLAGNISHFHTHAFPWAIILNNPPEYLCAYKVRPPLEKELLEQTSHNPARPKITKYQFATSQLDFREIRNDKLD